MTSIRATCLTIVSLCCAPRAAAAAVQAAAPTDAVVLTDPMIEAIVWLVALVGIVWVMVLLVSGGRSAHRPRVGSAAAGAVYDMLNEDKRNAIEIIVEGRAEARDPEDKDGNLPELEGSEGREDREGRGVRQRD